ncbi:MAG: hypothetical protein KAY37_13535 [Phycisphaerae bacterium]|nr:hypothetical protein [Phycisphaerae bacterium]
MASAKDSDATISDCEQSVSEDQLALLGPGADCLSYNELAALASGQRSPNPRQAEHLGSCLSCRTVIIVTACEKPVVGHPLLREDAWRADYARSTGWTDFIALIRQNAPRRRWVIHWAVSLAAAAIILLAVIPAWLSSSRHGTQVSEIVHVEWLPGTTRSDERREDTFRISAAEACTVLEVFRTWDNAGQVLDWGLGERVSLAAGEAYTLKLDVTDDPPGEQLLALVVAQQPGELPAEGEPAAAVLKCLRRAVPPAETGDTAAALAALRACLPEQTTLAWETFDTQ